MQWYYASNGKQQGPVGGEEFQRLVREGVIRSDTFVWQHGMPSWQPYASVGGGQPASVVSSPSSAAVTTDATVAVGAENASAGAEPAPGAAPGTGRNATLQLEFSGNTGEFFKIWIVNLLLTVVTLGIYAAWAKVRTRRYFYGNTRLAGHAFEYLANPRRILVGNLIVAAVFMLYSFLASVSPFLQMGFVVLMLPAVPWFLVNTYRFNARNSAWRGLRFSFGGRYREAFVNFVLLQMLVPLSFGLMTPYVVRRQKEFVLNNHAFGTSRFQFVGTTQELVRIFGIALLFFLPVIIVYVVLIVTIAGAAVKGGGGPATLPPGMAWLGLLALPAFPLAFAGAFYLRSRLFNYIWSNTSVSGHRFEAFQRARDLIWLQISNSLVILCTFGLMYPWAAIRMLRYNLERLNLVTAGDLDSFTAASQPEVGALADAASDFLDLDLGFGL